MAAQLETFEGQHPLILELCSPDGLVRLVAEFAKGSPLAAELRQKQQDFLVISVNEVSIEAKHALGKNRSNKGPVTLPPHYFQPTSGIQS